METVTEKKYVCEYCRSEYTTRKAALACLATCKLRSLDRLQWFRDNPPEYKVGDFIYSPNSGYTLLVKSIAKHSKLKCWVYHVVDYLGCANWFDLSLTLLLVSRLLADAQGLALTNMLQGYAVEHIFFTACTAKPSADIKPEIETHIILKGRYAWKR